MADCQQAMTFTPSLHGDPSLRAQRGNPSPVDYILHQAALGSVPRSVEDPITTNAANITGFLNILVAARDAKVKRFVYAASSSTYGDHPGLPKVEDTIGKPSSLRAERGNRCRRHATGLDECCTRPAGGGKTSQTARGHGAQNRFVMRVLITMIALQSLKATHEQHHCPKPR